MMMFKASSSDSGSNISSVECEDLYHHNLILYATDYEAIRGFMTSYVNTPNDDLMTNKEVEKRGKYREDRRDNETTYIATGI